MTRRGSMPVRRKLAKGFLYGKDEAGCFVHEGGWFRGRRGGLIAMWLRLQPRKIHEIAVGGFGPTTKRHKET
jgi:hypothetical protein